MRSILAFLFGLFLFGCSPQNSLLTEKEFAKVYVDSLNKKYPDVEFELNSDLTITSTKGNLDYKHYIDNAYVAYKSEPDSIESIINQYVTSTSELYADKSKINLENIVPVIKSNEYLEEIKSLGEDGKSFSMITEKYNDQLIIAYAEDTENSIKYLTENDYTSLSIPRDSLKSVALRNLDKIVPDIQRQGENGLFFITAGGAFEASLLLLPSIWTKANFPVDGDFVIAIPNRDLLVVTGSNDKKGIDKLKNIVADSYQNGNYQVSEHLYKWTGRKFEWFK